MSSATPGPPNAPGTSSAGTPSAGTPSAGAPQRPVSTAGETLVRIARLAAGMLPPIHPEGRRLVAGTAAAALLLRGLATPRRLATPLARTGALAAVALAWFFREPVRVAPAGSHLVVAPADGTIAEIADVAVPAELDAGTAPRPRVSIFLSVLDVHVQRLPATGTVTAVAYRTGAFDSADRPEASQHNERNSVRLRTDSGHELVVVQIAGLVARRIRCDLAEGDAGAAGTTYGLIRFGSRVDIYLPPGARMLAAVGQRTIGGETILAELPPEVDPPPPGSAGG